MVFETRPFFGTKNLLMSARNSLLNDLVNEVSKDEPDIVRVRELAEQLDIPYSENEIEFLNNVLRGIHGQDSSHDGNI